MRQLLGRRSLARRKQKGFWFWTKHSQRTNGKWSVLVRPWRKELVVENSCWRRCLESWRWQLKEVQRMPGRWKQQLFELLSKVVRWSGALHVWRFWRNCQTKARKEKHLQFVWVVGKEVGCGFACGFSVFWSLKTFESLKANPNLSLKGLCRTGTKKRRTVGKLTLLIGFLIVEGARSEIEVLVVQWLLEAKVEGWLLLKWLKETLLENVRSRSKQTNVRRLNQLEELLKRSFLKKKQIKPKEKEKRQKKINKTYRKLRVEQNYKSAWAAED